MKKISRPRTALIASALLGLMVCHGQAHAASMSKADYRTKKSSHSADYKADKAACSVHTDNAKDICIEQAKAKEKIALAELEYTYSGKPADRNKVLVAHAKAQYSVAREMCDDKTDNAKDVCVQEAKAAQTKALADAKLGKDVSESKVDAAQDKQEADYKVAIEKCDASMGNTKTSCVAAAKAKFHQP